MEHNTSLLTVKDVTAQKRSHCTISSWVTAQKRFHYNITYSDRPKEIPLYCIIFSDRPKKVPLYCGTSPSVVPVRRHRDVEIVVAVPLKLFDRIPSRIASAESWDGCSDNRHSHRNWNQNRLGASEPKRIHLRIASPSPNSFPTSTRAYYRYRRCLVSGEWEMNPSFRGGEVSAARRLFSRRPTARLSIGVWVT